MTARELIEILQCDDGLWLDVPVVDCFCDEITDVLFKAEYIRLSDDDEEATA